MHKSKYTLHDLPNVPRKEFIKEAFRAVLANKTPAYDPVLKICKYKTAESACAIGVCLTPEQQEAEISKINPSAPTLIEELKPFDLQGETGAKRLRLLLTMQRIHDIAAEACIHYADGNVNRAVMDIKTLITSALSSTKKDYDPTHAQLVLGALCELRDELANTNERVTDQ